MVKVDDFTGSIIWEDEYLYYLDIYANGACTVYVDNLNFNDEVMWTVPRAGQLGYFARTEYNKQILKIGEDGEEVTPANGFKRYGKVGVHCMVKGSVPGPSKRLVRIRDPIRPKPKGLEDKDVRYLQVVGIGKFLIVLILVQEKELQLKVGGQAGAQHEFLELKDHAHTQQVEELLSLSLSGDVVHTLRMASKNLQKKLIKRNGD